jgi:transaldolase/transaldolase/glucose-6-phosphate isomerase
MSNLKALWDKHGQAVWLDFIQRSLLTGGGLARLVEADGVRGVTSNPTIFQKAITGSDEYDEQVADLLAERPDLTTNELYEALAISDIQLAADVLRPVYDSASGADGFVSLEVSPHLAHDSERTIEEAQRLWHEVSRPNLMIKVPATAAGIPAIESLIARGINVNATLMFSLQDYENVAMAYLRGLAACSDPAAVASVASFFVSRVDTQVDAELERIGTPQALALRGRTAVANSRVTYRRFLEVFHGDDFAPMRERGAKVQRPLWASTSTKNQELSDVLYVEELIGPETVNTIPTNTLDAFRDHGRPRSTLAEGIDDAVQVLAEIEQLGIDLDSITNQLQIDGVAAFAASFDDLIQALASKQAACAEER